MHRSSPSRLWIFVGVTILPWLYACSARTATVETEPASEPAVADYYGTYDLYLSNTPPDQPLTAVWSATDFVVSQEPGSPAIIQANVAIDPAGPGGGDMRIWAEGDPNPLCSAEGLYEYTDDGTEMRLTLVTDPCANRAASANGSRLVRRSVQLRD